MPKRIKSTLQGYKGIALDTWHSDPAAAFGNLLCISSKTATSVAVKLESNGQG
jgi:hypothetical protein